jgi:predicted O-methyltransferase YrrM
MAPRELRPTNYRDMGKERRRLWSADEVLELGRSYQGAAVLAAAAELELFTPLALRPMGAADLASALACDPRALTILLDALTALRILAKAGDRYSLEEGIKGLLTPSGPETVLAMAQHQANCLRNWAQLAKVVKAGRAAEKIPSVRGQAGDLESFIGATHNVSAPAAEEVIKAVQPLSFQHLLDIGGASGTWTMAFLRACPSGRATLFDLPRVIPMAKRRLQASGFAERVTLAAGDFMADALPAGADLVWVSAIVHQNSRAQNRSLFKKTFHVMQPGGRIAIRDIVMDESRTQPGAGALFAVNMLVATDGGGTYTLPELKEDLESAGFVEVRLVRRDEGMNAVLQARKLNKARGKGRA